MTEEHQPCERVKIFGERNTGTNALKQLIESNSASLCLAGADGEVNLLLARLAIMKINPPVVAEFINDLIYVGRSPRVAWKHSATNFGAVEPFRNCLVLFTVRHPASWLVSLFKNPYHRLGAPAVDLRDFLDTPWKTVRRERLGGRSFHPLALYMNKLELNLEYSAKLSTAGVKSMFIRHEDIVLAQEQVFRKVASSLVDSSGAVQRVSTATKQSARSLDQIKSYYIEERWRSALEGLESRVNRQIDWSAIRQFGYAPL